MHKAGCTFNIEFRKNIKHEEQGWSKTLNLFFRVNILVSCEKKKNRTSERKQLFAQNSKFLIKRVVSQVTQSKEQIGTNR